MIIELKQNDRVLATDVVSATEAFETRHLKWAERKAAELSVHGKIELALKTLAGAIHARHTLTAAA